MKEREFWRERATGRVFAVELDEGVVSGCCGPLDVSDVEDEFLPTFDYEHEQGAWLERHREEFELHRTETPYSPEPR
jgi:hypothetical protein